MAKYTVILKAVAYFFGDDTDQTYLFHVDASNPAAAVKAAQEDLIENQEIDRNVLQREGGADKIIPGHYVFDGWHLDRLEEPSFPAAA